LTLNLSAVVDRWAEDFQVVVFLHDTITEEQQTLLRKRLDGEMAVREVTYVSKKEALAKFRRQMGGQDSLLEGMNTNRLPALFDTRIHGDYKTAGALDH